ncbi:hypothetical protein LINPERHAP1_LOCUS16991 [Linum perenne]
MSVFFLSAIITKKTAALVRYFFWSGSTTKRLIHWCNEDMLSDSKVREGRAWFQKLYILQHDPPSHVRVVYFKQPRRHVGQSSQKYLLPYVTHRDARPSWIWSNFFKSRDIVALEL